MKDKRYDFSPSARWTPRLAQRWSPISSYFLGNYHRLRHNPGDKGLTSTSVLVIIQLMDFKWGNSPSFPSVETIATRMGLTTRSIQKALSTLEDLGYIVREKRPGTTSIFRFEGLFDALEDLMDSDEAKKEAA